MAWRDELQQASFRGAPFQVGVAGTGLGRRNQQFEFPQRDTPLSEDLGRRARRFTIEAYVLGDDYIAQRDALEAAIEAEGPGTLVHPYRGELRVVVVDHLTTETEREGGMATFSITFTEAGETQTPAVSEDTAVLAKAQADALSLSSALEFAETFSIPGLASFVPQAAIDLINAVVSVVGEVAGFLNGIGLVLSAFNESTDHLVDNAPALILDPPALAVAVTEQIAALAALASTPDECVAALLPLMTFGDDLEAIPATTPSRVQQAENQAAIVTLVREAAAVALARAVAAETFESYQDAVARRDAVADALEAAALASADAGMDAAFKAMDQLRLAVVRDITARGGSLRRLYDYTPAATQPALVIAYRLYDDATREAEIVARNAIRRPGFTPGGEALEVLTRDAAGRSQ